MHEMISITYNTAPNFKHFSCIRCISL